jgi:hypothetical protein
MAIRDATFVRPFRTQSSTKTPLNIYSRHEADTTSCNLRPRLCKVEEALLTLSISIELNSATRQSEISSSPSTTILQLTSILGCQVEEWYSAQCNSCCARWAKEEKLENVIEHWNPSPVQQVLYSLLTTVFQPWCSSFRYRPRLKSLSLSSTLSSLCGI